MRRKRISGTYDPVQLKAPQSFNILGLHQFRMRPLGQSYQVNPIGRNRKEDGVQTKPTERTLTPTLVCSLQRTAPAEFDRELIRARTGEGKASKGAVRASYGVGSRDKNGRPGRECRVPKSLAQGGPTP
jgi:hypothetical protein